MKTTSPHNCGRALALAAVSLGLISTSFGASYTLDLYSEANPGKYTFAPDTNLAADLGTYASVATSLKGSITTFWTFCLESQEHFQAGKRYNASGEPVATTTSTNDPISVGTAFLYEQFVTGNLDGFYTNSGGARMQKMIWHLEDENGAGFGQYDTELGNLLISAGYVGLSAMKADYTGTSVGVLVLTKYSGSGGDTLTNPADKRQDQLVYWGPKPGDGPPTDRVPDGGTTLLLFGLSLAGLGFAKRKQKA